MRQIYRCKAKCQVFTFIPKIWQLLKEISQKKAIVWRELYLQPCIKSFLQINKMQIVKFTRSKDYFVFSGDTIIYGFPECGFKHFVEREVWDFGRRALISSCFQRVETLSLFWCQDSKNSPHITFWGTIFSTAVAGICTAALNGHDGISSAWTQYKKELLIRFEHSVNTFVEPDISVIAVTLVYLL